MTVKVRFARMYAHQEADRVPLIDEVKCVGKY